MSRIVVLGDSLLDRDVEGRASRLTPDAPAPVLDEHEARSRPGGAGLAAVLAARDGHEVTLITALSDDDAGRTLASSVASTGVDVVDLGSRGPTAEKIRLRADGRTLVRWDRGARGTATDVGAWTSAADAALAAADGVLVSCYGRGVADRHDVRAAVRGTATARPVVWDPHVRGRGPVRDVAVVTPNRSEAVAWVPTPAGESLDAETRRAEAVVRRFEVAGCATTLGAAGALYTTGGGLPLVVPAPPVRAGDPCGAGDRFATALTTALAAGRLPAEAVADAVVAASRFVACGGAASLVLTGPGAGEPPSDDPIALADQVRARGGRVVATGGCFDILHSGHVHLLEAARALGDCLVVCLNSDASVRRLKGPDRPFVPAADRAALLRALGCVDGVLVFDEDTPERVLRELRPEVFAKGGDYGSTHIPEADVVAAWGGQAVTLPYLVGRSTTGLVEEVRRREPL